MYKSDNHKMYDSSHSPSENHTNSKEMEAYSQPILWPSLKQMDKNQFELRQ